MSKVVLPYTLSEGQVAYATRVMANLNALLTKINHVSVSGLAEGDMEQALQELKYLLDREAAADQKVLADFAYDGVNRKLVITQRDGARFEVSMTPFYNDYSGAASDTLALAVDGERRVSGTIRDGAVNYAMLAEALRGLIDGKVSAAEPGNAELIRFSDGKTMQQKLDQGELRGADGVTARLDAAYYFRVGDNGHLYVGVADGAAQPPLSIDAQGHLVYTID